SRQYNDRVDGSLELLARSKVRPDHAQQFRWVPGLEALYPLLVKGLEERNLPFTHAAKLLARNPARHFRLFAKGALDVGCDADITVMKRSPYRYEAAASGHNIVDWSPYDGIMLPWRVEATYLRGE